MNGRIDNYIDIHFRDLVMAAGGGAEEFVAIVDKNRVDDVRRCAGVQILGETAEVGNKVTLAISASASARRSLLESELVNVLHATARRPRIPVLLHLKRLDWNDNVLGFERGSQVGQILTGRATEDAIDALANNPDVIAIEASRSGGSAECVKSMPWIGIPVVHSAPYAEKGAGAIVAVIDEGIDVLHEAFRDSQGKSRILAVWDQRDSSGPDPFTVDPSIYDQKYGTLHTRDDISRYLDKKKPGKNLGRDPGGHGTHVASIAAGSPIGGGSSALVFPGGVAPEADLVVVIPKLTAGAGDPSSLGYSLSHVDALAFIRATAEKHRAPVAVNVSLGMNAGAHDGTSLLEMAFDSFSRGGRDPGYIVVKSAGNEFGYSGHSCVQAFQGGVVNIEWDSISIPRKEDYLEFWFQSSDDLKFTLIDPNGSQCSVDYITPEAEQHWASGRLSIYLRLIQFYKDNGDSRLLIVVRNNGGGSLNVGGKWRLEIFGQKVFSQGLVHGWVERDEARALMFSTGNTNGLTLSIPGTAHTVIAVGACQSSAPLILSPSSSHGPTRDQRLKPELVAPGVNVVAAASGTTNSLIGMTGTSMAAPHVTGAAALLFAQRRRNSKSQLNAAQLKAALSQCLKNYHGRWQSGFGNGALDVVELLNAFK